MKRSIEFAAGTRAGIYCRKSTSDEQRGRRADSGDPDLKSTAIQEGNARKLAEECGLTIQPDHVYKDEKISGATISRPGLDGMKAALGIVEGERQRRAPDPASRAFDVLIVRDQSRLIRNASHALQLLEQIVATGAEIVFYKTKQVIRKENFPELLVGVQGHIDSEHRKKASVDAREGLDERAKLGRNCGGVCFGYRNVKHWGKDSSGQPVHLYTDFEIDKAQARVVKQVFTMFVAGYGTRAIAKAANGDSRYRAESREFFGGLRPAKPMVGKRGSGSWAPSAVRDMLRNPRYVGELVYGRMKNERDQGGVKFRVKQSEKDAIIRTVREDLRIIPQPLWDAAQKRINAMAKAYLRHEAKDGALKYGSPETGRHSRYLLSGIFQCPECGASLIAHKMSMGAGRTRKLVAVYVCSANNRRGDTICKNNARVRQAELDARLMGYIERDVLTPERASAAFRKAVEDGKARLKRDPGLRKKLETEIAAKTRQKANLIALSEQSLDDPQAVATRINELGREIDRLNLELSGLPEAQYDEKKLEEKKAHMLERLKRFSEMVRDKRNIPLLRQLIRHAIAIYKLKLTPITENGRRTYDISGWARVSQAPIRRVSMASPRGFEPRLPP